MEDVGGEEGAGEDNDVVIRAAVLGWMAARSECWVEANDGEEAEPAPTSAPARISMR